MYLTYPEYVTFGGHLSEEEFNELEYGAEVVINYHTFGRLKNETVIPEEVKRLIVVLVALVNLRKQSFNTNANTNAGIVKQSNDGVEIQYNVMSIEEVYSNCKKEIGATIKEYLDGVKNSKGQKLLYRGLYPGE